MRTWLPRLPLGVLLLAWQVSAAVQCDGVDDRLSTGVLLSALITPTAFTVVVTLRITGTPTPTETNCFESAYITGDANGYFVMARFSTGDLCVLMTDSQGRLLTTTTTPDTTMQVAMRLSGGTFSLWKDGVMVASVSGVSDQQDGPAGDIWLCSNDGLLPGSDRLEDVAYYNVALSDALLAAVGKARTRFLIPARPTAHWTFDDCADGASGHGVVFRDHSGNTRPVTGTYGLNETGLTCLATPVLSAPGGGE